MLSWSSNGKIGKMVRRKMKTKEWRRMMRRRRRKRKNQGVRKKRGFVGIEGENEILQKLTVIVAETKKVIFFNLEA